jgi:hypothetical protein
MTTNNLNNQCLNDFTITSSTSADTATLTVSNTSNTASSIARNIISVSNTSTSDLYTRYAVATTAQYAMGIDNGDADKWKIAYAASGATPSSTEVMTSDTTGRVRRPNSAAFRAHLNTAQTNKTGNAVNYTVPFDGESFDIGSNFNTSTGTFTAPVAGKYLFYGVVRASGTRTTTHTVGSTRISVNGTDFGIVICNVDVASNTDDQLSFYTHAYVSLASSDAVTLAIVVDGGSQDVDILDQFNFTYFCGMLIG